MIETTVFLIAGALFVVVLTLEILARLGIIATATAEWGGLLIGVAVGGIGIFIFALPDVALAAILLAIVISLAGVSAGVYWAVIRVVGGKSVREVWAERDSAARARRQERIAGQGPR